MRKAIIIGAGPAGLTAAYELLHKTDITPVLFEAGRDIGGLSRTVVYKGNRIDIGGHRFFSKSDAVMAWWQNILPLQGSPENQFRDGPDPDKTDRVMLLRKRSSRILFKRKFFNYPVSLSPSTLIKLGLFSTVKIGFSYLETRLGPNPPPQNLEDLFVHRFGKELYLTFFKDYTEKVWGRSCRSIKPEWGRQRIKNLSIAKTISNALTQMLPSAVQDSQKTETSLITQFLYPKYGPGQMWEEVAKIILKKGGEIHFGLKVTGMESKGNRITEVKVRNPSAQKEHRYRSDYVFSSMSVQELIRGFSPSVPKDVFQVNEGLEYRDFIIVGILLNKMDLGTMGLGKNSESIPPDQWIYIQENDVKVARVQIFNNWSPYLVNNKNTIWIGVEYFCNRGDAFWNLSQQEILEFAVHELIKIGFMKKDDFLDGTVIKIPHAYPAYFGAYENFDVIRQFTDSFENLFLIGRNGMHRYNNQDHSMLSAITAVNNIVQGISTRDNIWAVNTEEILHES